MSNQSTIDQQFTASTSSEVERLAPICRSMTPKEAREQEARESKKRKTSASGQASSSSSSQCKRKADAAAPAYQPDEEMFAEYRCPITQELPVEPVVAEDGQCYERTAIEEWFEKHTVAKSPMTNQPIGKTLVTAVQTRNAIERLIKKGVLAGEAADAWTERQDELKCLDKANREKLAKAYKGDVLSMRMVGFCYRDGTHGFKKNQAKTIEWFRKAAKGGSPMAIVSLGVFYINGNGVPRDVTRGMIELTRAAMLGSEHGAICIANHFATGESLVSKDEGEATMWYEFSRNRTVKDSTSEFRKRRDNWLRERGLLSDE